MSDNVSKKLHLGCGLTAPDGWMNVDGSWQVELANRPRLRTALVKVHLLPKDRAEIPWKQGIMRLNLANPLPFPDNTFDVIYTSHTLEHLYVDDARRLLRECLRILRPSGICRVVVPDLASLVTDYQEAKKRGDARAADRFMEGLNAHDRINRRGLMGLYYRLTAFGDHKWMFDKESLLQFLVDAGFAEVKSCGYLESRIASIAEVEDRGRIENGQGIVAECVKPG